MLIEVCATVVLMCIVYYGIQLRSYRKQMEPIAGKCTELGPRHPIWGHLYLFSNGDELLQKMRKHVEESRTKLYVTWIMFFRVDFHVCHPDTVRDLLKSSEPKPKYTTGSVYRLFMPWLGDGLLVSSGPKWERNRRLLTPAFHFEILKPYIKEYNRTTDILLKNMETKMEKEGNFEVYELVSMATLDTMLRCALSYEGEVQELGGGHPYVSAVKRLSALVFERVLAPWYSSDFVYFKSSSGREFKKLTKFVHDFAEQIIASRKEALLKQGDISGRRLDFLDILLTAKDESGKGLSSENIREEVDTFLFEGHDTTASAISWAIYALGKYQSEQDKVYTEIKEILQDREYVEWDDVHNATRLTAFLKEVLRMYTTIPIIIRWLTKPLVVDGVEIPANTSVNLILDALHHHPDVWPDHMEFRSDRFEDNSANSRDPFSYVPFSAGPRNCIGQHFAMNEQRVMIARILSRFKIHLVPGHKYEPLPEMVRRAKYGIKVILEKRK